MDKKLDSFVPSYKIKEYDGTPVKGTFYEEELQKVNMGEDSFFRIEKVLKKKDGKALVSWKGWPSKYDSWVNQKDIRETEKIVRGTDSSRNIYNLFLSGRISLIR